MSLFHRNRAPELVLPDKGSNTGESMHMVLKHVGIFAVQTIQPGTKEFSMYQRAGIVGDKDEAFLDLHLSRDISRNDATPESIRRSLGMVAQYLEGNQDAGQEVVGLTYPHLGRVATQFGFKMSQVNANMLPLRIIREIRSSNYSPGMDAGITGGLYLRDDNTVALRALEAGINPDLNTLVAVHQSAGDFIDRFGQDAQSGQDLNNHLPIAS